MFGRRLGDMIHGMEEQGWDRDATFVLLCLVRELFYQYIEKVDFGNGSVHERVSKSGIWDSISYRTVGGNPAGTCVIVARNTGTGPLTMRWILDSSICNLISLDLVKSAVGIYDQDNHRPSAIVQGRQQHREGNRDASYRSVYLQLMDDLVETGAPEPIVHYGTVGFL
ncbi:hypothetical protein G6O67_007705 [Ophiocordyceps sinensis]|uniref:Uncharacterized protein n=1 Tax=Ophiocordyceps sinensis TaxID=72228 RepID=A0A8H4PJM9_9HYPO|nr:hypothetical protein G6O67_007705 [Ophiocordyceps sinensis]